MPCGGLFGGDHVHEEDGVGFCDARGSGCKLCGGRVKECILVGMGDGGGINVVAVDGGGAEERGSKRKDAAATADVDDVLMGNVRGHELEGELCSGMRKISKARAREKAECLGSAVRGKVDVCHAVFEIRGEEFPLRVPEVH